MQQAGNKKDLSYFERSGSLSKAFTMYKKSPFQYFNASATAMRNLIKKRGTTPNNLKKLAIAHFGLPMLFQWVSDGFEIDEENQLRAAILGSFNGIAITGGILKAAWDSAMSDGNLYKKMWAFGEQVPIAGMAIKAGDAVVNGVDLFASEFASGDFWEYADEIAKNMSYWMGLPYAPVKRNVEGVKDVIEGKTDHPIRRSMGYSKYTLEKDKKKTSGTNRTIKRSSKSTGTDRTIKRK